MRAGPRRGSPKIEDSLGVREEVWDLLGRKVEKRAKIAEIYSMAAKSIGLPIALDSPAMDMLRLQLSRYQLLNEQREQLDSKAQELLADNLDFQ